MAVSVNSGALARAPAAWLLAAAALGLGAHAALLAAHSFAAAALQLGGDGRGEGGGGGGAAAAAAAAVAAVRRPVVLAASQKTLPVAVAVLGALGGAAGEPALLLLPCICFHLACVTGAQAKGVSLSFGLCCVFV